MLPLNAIDAIAPALKRVTNLFFARPRKFGRAWKLGASAYLAYCGSLFIPYPLLLLLVPWKTLPIDAPVLRIIVTSSIVLFGLYLVLFYFGARMQFVMFEAIVTSNRKIAPMWSRYGGRVWPWMLMKIVIGTALCSALAPLLAGSVRMMVRGMQANVAQPGATADPAALHALMASMQSLQLTMNLALLLLLLAATLQDDFVLPFFALEAMPLTSALARAGGVFASDPVQLLGYLGMKLLLAIVGGVFLEVGVVIAAIPLVLIGFLGVGIGSVVRHAIPGPAGHGLGFAFEALFIGGAYIAFIALITGASGYLILLLQGYGIYFLGGRYRLLGEYLQPPPPSAPFAPPPVFPSPEEGDDDDGGPPMPLNPALA